MRAELEPRSRDGLPSGWLTYMLTDIEGSTRLWEQHPQDMAEALARHDRLISAMVEANAGTLVRSRGEGDSIFAVFTDAGDALACAVEVQLAFVQEAWPPATPIRTRVALHRGEADLRAGDYYGQSVNRCARLRAVAHGGQTLLTQAIAKEVRDRLPEGVSLRDLGVHHLRDLTLMERVYQLEHPGLPADYPPLVTAASDNLPAELSSFVGRDAERAELARLLQGHRLITLTGSGGCGKTRLALRLARDISPEYVDGTWLVELAHVADADLVPQVIASTLGLREGPGDDLDAALVRHLRGRRTLLVLDNCEHLVSACASTAARLLGACAELTIVATSREQLSVPGEVAWRVPSLAMPDGDDLTASAASDSVRLFMERVETVAPGFSSGPDDVAAAVDICRHLDGIPLAIELAAGRVGVLTPRQVAERLDDRFRLLSGPARAAVPRHQTLRATVDWSYDLLAEPERALLERLSVFAGGWDLEAAEVVCGGDGIEAREVLEMLGQLVVKSLVVVERRGAAARYRMLETIREYGAQRLAGGGAQAGVVRRHRDWCLLLAEEAEDRLLRGQQVSWDRLEAEHDNLRAALKFSLEDPGGAEAALRLGGALGEFWDLRGNLAEGRRWLELALERSSDASLQARAKALNALGMLISHQGDYPSAHAMFEESLALARRGGDQQVVSTTLGNLGWIFFSEGRAAEARRYLEEGVELARELGDRWIIARAIYLLCHVEGVEDQDACVRLATESMAIAQGTRGAVDRGALALLPRRRRDLAGSLRRGARPARGERGHRRRCRRQLAGAVVPELPRQHVDPAGRLRRRPGSLRAQPGDGQGNRQPVVRGALRGRAGLGHPDGRRRPRPRQGDGRGEPAAVPGDRHPHRHRPVPRLPGGVRAPRRRPRWGGGVASRRPRGPRQPAQPLGHRRDPGAAGTDPRRPRRPCRGCPLLRRRGGRAREVRLSHPAGGPGRLRAGHRRHPGGVRAGLRCRLGPWSGGAVGGGHRGGPGRVKAA